MSENKTPLIGTPANVTVFAVDYEYQKPGRKNKLPKSAKKEDDSVKNTAVIITGDPSGEDLYGITRRVVLGADPYEGSDFRILIARRVCDAMGLAQVTTWAKIDGKATEAVGEIATDDEEDDDDGTDGGSMPPGAELN